MPLRVLGSLQTGCVTNKRPEDANQNGSKLFTLAVKWTCARNTGKKNYGKVLTGQSDSDLSWPHHTFQDNKEEVLYGELKVPKSNKYIIK